MNTRTSGILLHPTSLPGPYGIGDLGPSAFGFVDFLAAAGQGLWQVLPLGPTGYGDSPYSSLSAFAGNPLLISPERLHQEGWLQDRDLAAEPFADQRVDFATVIPWKMALLQRAYRRFQTHGSEDHRGELQRFYQRHYAWLDDYALFSALKDHHGGAPWVQWEASARLRDPVALDHWRERLRDVVDLYKFIQFQFFRQWRQLHSYATERGVQLIGDIPIFVAHDSAEVWVHRDWFQLDPDGLPTVVAGVPPDYFSSTGQRWGNPLYRWDVLAEDGYSFWIQRLSHLLSVVDRVRLDHFRGFAACWEIPAHHPTAEHGRWVTGPGADLFRVLRRELGTLPLIAEDLGVITPDVEALRDGFDLPGMAILQFAFEPLPPEGFGVAIHRPHYHIQNLVVYTGTHDNETLRGWWDTVPEALRVKIRRYMHTDGAEPHWDFIRTALASVARDAIMPLQDLLGLGAEATMNRPGRPGDNWSWRYRAGDLDSGVGQRLRELSVLYDRAPRPPA